MKNYFGPQKPVDDSSNLWRAIVAGTSIFVGLVILGVLYYNKIPGNLSTVSVAVKTLTSVANPEKASAGGDVTVAPPEIEKPKLPELMGEMINQDDFSAKAIIVKDKETGTILFAKNEYQKRPIASITKLMSALVVLEKNPDWDSTFVVIPDDIIDTHMYAGDTYTLDDLWYSALIASSNKAIYTLADAVGWPRAAFVERMNQKAQELGMVSTKFVEPTGLSADNVSTASDLSILLEEALRQEKVKKALLKPEYNLYSAERKKSHHMWNTNWLLLGWIPNEFAEIVGGKTGYIPESGYNFSVQLKNEAENVLNVIVLGAGVHEARFTEARDIANWTFANYKWPNNN